MQPPEVRAFMERHGLSAAALGRLLDPPLDRHRAGRLVAGKLPIGSGMAARLREAMRKIERDAA